MATNKLNERPAELGSFKRLNHKTYLWTPPPGDNNSSSITNQTSFPNTAGTPPDLILIGSWMNASLRHVAKFTEYYQLIYPSSPILVITSSAADFFFNTARKEAADYAPAVATVRAYTDQWSASGQDHSFRTPGEGGGLLVHGFSNGGGGQVAFLAEHYKAATGHPLPARAVILDSLPGRPRFLVDIRTLSLGLPKAWYVRWPLQLAFAVLLAIFFQIPEALGRQTLATRLRDDLNAVASGPRLGEVKEKGKGKESEAVIRKEAPRCYIYSDADVSILDHDIEDHADEADAKGLKVKRVKFTGTKHVEHMRTDPERYWSAVRGTWDVRV